MVERRQLTDEHVALWREGCELLAAMSPREFNPRGTGSERYYKFLQINKRPTWTLVSPASPSLFDAELDGDPPPYLRPSPRHAI